MEMEWSEIERRWEEIATHAQRRWERLSNTDLHDVAGRRLKLIGRVQRRYSLTFRIAKEQVAAWRASLQQPWRLGTPLRKQTTDG